MRRAFRAAAVSALLAAAFPAAAWVRETTSVGHPGSGVCLWSRSRQVTYQVNIASAAAACFDPQTAVSAVAAGFDAWGTASTAGASCTDFRFVKGPPATTTAVARDGVNLVVFRTSRCSDVVPPLDSCLTVPRACAAKFNCWDYEFNTLGYTTPFFDTRTGELLEADMELFAGDGTYPVVGHYFTCAEPSAAICTSYGEPSCNAVDVTALVTHEAGHVLGLDHVCSDEFQPPYDVCPSGAPVMAPSVGNVARRALAADDVTGICTIYPLGGATLTCAPPDPPRSGGCACGGGAGIASLLAVLAARRRSRRA